MAERHVLGISGGKDSAALAVYMRDRHLEHGSPFTWSKGESLADMEKPKRIAEIQAEYGIRRARMLKSIPINPLRPVKACPDDIDDIYGVDEGNGSCVVCHK